MVEIRSPKIKLVITFSLISLVVTLLGGCTGLFFKDPIVGTWKYSVGGFLVPKYEIVFNFKQ